MQKALGSATLVHSEICLNDFQAPGWCKGVSTHPTNQKMSFHSMNFHVGGFERSLNVITFFLIKHMFLKAWDSTLDQSERGAVTGKQILDVPGDAAATPPRSESLNQPGASHPLPRSPLTTL